MLTPLRAKGTASDARMPTSSKSNGPATFNARQPPSTLPSLCEHHVDKESVSFIYQLIILLK
jgi:hypothetical protein